MKIFLHYVILVPVMLMSIYDRIRQLRIAAGMSQDDLARAMGYSDRSMITKIESGKVDISQKKIVAFADVLHTTPAYLMGWVDENGRFVEQEYATTEEARIISGGIDRMPKDKREQALRVLRAAFAEYSRLFEEENNDDA